MEQSIGNNADVRAGEHLRLALAARGDLAPGHPTAHFLLGQAWIATGAEEEARAEGHAAVYGAVGAQADWVRSRAQSLLSWYSPAAS